MLINVHISFVDNSYLDHFTSSFIISHYPFPVNISRVSFGILPKGVTCLLYNKIRNNLLGFEYISFHKIKCAQRRILCAPFPFYKMGVHFYITPSYNMPPFMSLILVELTNRVMFYFNDSLWAPGYLNMADKQVFLSIK